MPVLDKNQHHASYQETCYELPKKTFRVTGHTRWAQLRKHYDLLLQKQPSGRNRGRFDVCKWRQKILRVSPLQKKKNKFFFFFLNLYTLHVLFKVTEPVRFVDSSWI